MRVERLASAALIAALGLWIAAGSGHAASVVSPSACSGIGVSIAAPGYACVNLGALTSDPNENPGGGSNSGIAFPTGGIAFLDNNTLLVGGGADTPDGAIYSVPVIRDGSGSITGFGVATKIADAPNIDGGLIVMPNGTMLFTQYGTPGEPNSNSIGEILPGHISPDRTIVLPTDANGASVSTMAFYGSPSLNQLRLATFDDDTWWDATLTALTGDQQGLFDLGSITAVETLSGGSLANTAPDCFEGTACVGPEGILFTGSQILVSAWSNSEVFSYADDGNGNPTIAPDTDPVSTAPTLFISGLTCADSMIVDPVTGDLLITGQGNNSCQQTGPDPILRVTRVPEPGSLALLASSLVGFGWVRRRRQPAC